MTDSWKLKMVRNALWLFVATVIILIIFLPSYTKLQDLRQKNFEYSHQIRQFTDENARLREEKRRLEDDPVYLEKVAREKMGIVREGEVVYKITPVNKIETDSQGLKKQRSR